MAFVNEYISKEDFKRYALDEHTNRFIGGSGQWTIDRERNMYLRNVANGRDDASHLSTWTFFWHDALILVHLELLETQGGVGEACSSHKRIRKIEMPEHLKQHRAEMLKDLYDALLAYKDGGVYSKSTAYSLTLDAVGEPRW